MNVRQLGFDHPPGRISRERTSASKGHQGFDDLLALGSQPLGFGPAMLVNGLRSRPTFVGEGRANAIGGTPALSRPSQGRRCGGFLGH